MPCASVEHSPRSDNHGVHSGDLLNGVMTTRTSTAKQETYAAGQCARDLLAQVGFANLSAQARSDHPALAWRRAGLMDVTGFAEGEGLVSPVALTSAADGALAAFSALAPEAPLPLNGALLLGERARMRGLYRAGAVSPNGTCRLIATADAHIGLSLARESDWDLVPAWLCCDASRWPEIEAVVATRRAQDLLDRAHELGLPVAKSESAPAASPFEITRLGRTCSAPARAPLVVDLSSLWAGPLAGVLLAQAGARVVKVESTRRPDGARAGHGDFYALLNGGKKSVGLDFHDPAGVADLHRLIAAADIVIESARPRAMEQLGVEAEAQAAAGKVWVSITGYGRGGEAAARTGFGDDASVAGGVASAMLRHWDAPIFAGDAIADPLAGLFAAVAAWAGWRAGGGWLVSVPLAQAARYACSVCETDDVRGWQASALKDTAPLYPLRRPSGAVRPLGADTAAVLSSLTARA